MVENSLVYPAINKNVYGASRLRKPNISETPIKDVGIYRMVLGLKWQGRQDFHLLLATRCIDQAMYTVATRNVPSLTVSAPKEIQSPTSTSVSALISGGNSGVKPSGDL